jgi:hypothetical protein
MLSGKNHLGRDLSRFSSARIGGPQSSVVLSRLSLELHEQLAVPNVRQIQLNVAVGYLG